MKPRIFISSTFYDLKYVREDISNFVKAHDFEPILFEDGDIGYIPGKQLDDSCYESMRSADMVILIIGGNYGSPVSDGETNINDKFDEYISITRKEFKTALDAGIPIFAFIESSVYSEYDIYELNRISIEQNKSSVKFAATKDINVFRFINEVKSLGNISITEFRKPSEIKEFLGKQWSDMFKNYLKSLREQKEYNKTHDSIDELRSTINEMRVLVNGVFEKTFNSQIELEYDSVKKEQRYIRAQSIVRNILNSIHFDIFNYSSEYDLHEIFEKFINLIINTSNKLKDTDSNLQKEENIDQVNDFIIEFFENSSKIGINIFSLEHDMLINEFIDELKVDNKLKLDVVNLLTSQFNRREKNIYKG